MHDVVDEIRAPEATEATGAWSFATAEEAERTAAFCKQMGIFSRQWGRMNHEHLVLHRNGEKITGLVYFIPDPLYTVVAELWLGRPEIAHTLEAAFKLFESERGRAGARIYLGYVDISKNRYIRQVLQQGARFGRVSMQIEWEG